MDRSVDVAGTGFTVLDRIYADDHAPIEALGGSCGNVMISLAMLDRSVAPLLVLGWDEAGETLLREFEGAGVDTQFIFRRDDVRSPILTQYLNTISGQHSFSFNCPETEERLPRYRPIEASEVLQAGSLLNGCSVFYSDRVTAAILEAMETAASSGATVYFEPSEIGEEDLFEQALALTSILKVSSDRIGAELGRFDLRAETILIVTHGSSGLEMRQEGKSRWCEAIRASTVRDTCGSGDMVTIGLIDWLLESGSPYKASWSLDRLHAGVVAGQRLAAANCAFAGARGLFSQCGAQVARKVLSGEVVDVFSQLDLFERAAELDW